MDLRKILEKKGLEGSQANGLKEYVRENPRAHSNELVEFREFWIPRREYKALEEIASAAGKTIHDYEVRSKKSNLGPDFSVDVEDNHITGLQITGHKLEKLPESINNLTELRRLNLGRTGKYSLPETIGNLEQLEELYINHNNHLRGLPESIGKLKNLRVLDVFCSFVDGMPKSIGDLEKLEVLVWDYTSLSFVPESIGNLTELRKLDISRNYFLKDLPQSIEKLEKLEELDLYLDRFLLKGYWKRRKLIKSLKKRGVNVER